MNLHGKDSQVVRGLGDDGSITNLPWASVFDPAANARALNAIQAEGFRAASKLVDRFVGSAGANGGSAEAASTTPVVASANGNGASLAGNPDFERLMKIWWSTAGQFLLGSARLANLPIVGPATLESGSAGGKGALELHVDSPGRAAADVWLHNRGPDDFGLIRLHCSDLLAHDGSVVPSGAMQFEPNPVPVPRRSSRGVAVNVDVAGGVRPGVYRGTLLADGNPDLWLPVVLAIRLPGS